MIFSTDIVFCKNFDSLYPCPGSVVFLFLYRDGVHSKEFLNLFMQEYMLVLQ